MKMNLKAKDFLNKAELEKTLSTKLKKPLMAVNAKLVEKLPFCYEVDYFGEGKGFMSVGVAKEIDKIYKTKRSKGQGKDENGKAVKVDKKKVAFGTVGVNDEGVYVFNVLGGIMKLAQAKKVIKSIPILKKTIGDNFIIVKGEGVAEEETTDDNEDVGVDPNDLDFGDEGEGDGDAPSSNAAVVATLKKQAVQLTAILSAFLKTEWKTVADNPRSAKAIMVADTKGQTILEKFATWLGNAEPIAEVAKELESIQKSHDGLKNKLGQVAAAVAKIKEKQGEKSNVDLDSISVDISGKIKDFLSGYGAEIDAIPDLKAALDAIGK